MENADIVNTRSQELLALAKTWFTRYDWDGGYVGKNVIGKCVLSFSINHTFQIDPTDKVEKVTLPFEVVMETLLETHNIREAMHIPFVTTRTDPELCALVCAWTARTIGSVIRMVESFLFSLPEKEVEPVAEEVPAPAQLGPEKNPPFYEEEQQLEDPPAPTEISLDENSTSAVLEHTKYLRVGKGKVLPDYFKLACGGSLVFSLGADKTYVIHQVGEKLVLTREPFKPLEGLTWLKSKG